MVFVTPAADEAFAGNSGSMSRASSDRTGRRGVPAGGPSARTIRTLAELTRD